MDVLQEALERIKPSKDEVERIFSIVDAFIAELNSRLKGARAIVGGSLAKGSFLRDIHDADIYVQFDPKHDSEEISGMLEKVLDDHEKLHGSRDYFQVKRDGLILEIIPIIRIEDAKQARNITDISPLHVEWVRKSALNDDMRLAKAFAKAQRVYGAESYIQGFSGYALEILVVYYGGFLKLLENAKDWKKPVVIDVEKQHEDVFKELNISKLNSPLILIDPVEAGRNATAALSDEKFDIFVKRAKEFLDSPSVDLFSKKEYSVEDIDPGDDHLIVVDVETERSKVDVVGCRILKVFEYIRNNLKTRDFNVIDCGWKFDKKTKGTLWYVVENKELSPIITWRGPPVSAESDAEKFRQKYDDIFEDKGRLYARVERKYKEPFSLVKDLFCAEVITDRVKSIQLRS